MCPQSQQAHLKSPRPAQAQAPKPLVPQAAEIPPGWGDSAWHFGLPRDAWQQVEQVPGMTGNVSVWLAVVFSCGKASDYLVSPNGFCLAVSSAQALSLCFCQVPMRTRG